MLLDFFGASLLVAAAVVNIHVLVVALSVGTGARLAITGLAGLWLGLQMALAASGAFTSQIAATIPLIGLMVVTPLAAVAIAAVVSARVRTALIEVPQSVLIGLNAGRVFGAFFLLLAANGRLGGPFPHSAGWGDVLTGLAAVPLALYAARRTTILAWNVFGAADLVLAVTLGTLSFNGFALQAIEAGAGSEAVQHLPWSLIPTVLVPFYLITHAIIFAQLRQTANTDPRVSAIRT